MVSSYCTLIIIFQYLAVPIGEATNIPLLASTMVNLASALTIGLLLFFPSLAIGTWIWSRKLAKQPINQNDSSSEVQNPKYFDIPISKVEDLLQTAKANKLKSLRFEFRSD